MAPLYPAIQKSIITAISQPQFSAALPPLSDAAWAKLLAPYDRSHDENERLEFLGDALMYATIGRMLYAQIPDGTPNLYTNVRAALHSNATFSHLAEKLDILAVSSSVLRALTIRNFGEAAAAPILKTKPEIKATADLFETVIGAYYLERGFEALCEWVKEIYRPLIIVAQKTYIEWHRSGKKRHRYDKDPEYLVYRPHKKPRVLVSHAVRKIVPLRSRYRAAESPLRSVKAAHRMMTSKVVSSVGGSDRRLGSPSSRPRTPNARTSAPIPKSSRKPIIIDLTVVSDSSDEEDSPAGKAISHRTTGHDHPVPPHASRSPLPNPDRPQFYQRSNAIVDDQEDRSSEEEIMLEHMLSMTVDSGSDMELGSET